MRIYKSFEEVANEIKNHTPETIYKFRDWRNPNHKKVITNLELWFAHPFKLNDPYDVRPPYNFIAENIDWDKARIMIRNAGKSFNPDFTDEELEKEVDLRLISMKKDPVSYFNKTRSHLIGNSAIYDRIGIMSFCMSFDNEAMWAYYGSDHSGFAVGFNTLELAREIDCTMGIVEYNNAPLNYYILGDNEGHLESEIFYKSEKWKNEDELRFATLGIGIYKTRIAKFLEQAVNEIVFGINTEDEVQHEITEVLNDVMPNVPVYKLITKTDSFGFDKVRIK